MTMTEKEINKNTETVSPLVISVESTLPSLPGKFSFFKYLYISVLLV